MHLHSLLLLALSALAIAAPVAQDTTTPSSGLKAIDGSAGDGGSDPVQAGVAEGGDPNAIDFNGNGNGESAHRALASYGTDGTADGTAPDGGAGGAPEAPGRFK